MPAESLEVGSAEERLAGQEASTQALLRTWSRTGIPPGSQSRTSDRIRWPWESHCGPPYSNLGWTPVSSPSRNRLRRAGEELCRILDKMLTLVSCLAHRQGNIGQQERPWVAIPEAARSVDSKVAGDTGPLGNRNPLVVQVGTGRTQLALWSWSDSSPPERFPRLGESPRLWREGPQALDRGNPSRRRANLESSTQRPRYPQATEECRGRAGRSPTSGGGGSMWSVGFARNINGWCRHLKPSSDGALVHTWWNMRFRRRRNRYRLAVIEWDCTCYEGLPQATSAT